jgi:hypothetical protein
MNYFLQFVFSTGGGMGVLVGDEDYFVYHLNYGCSKRSFFFPLF